MEWKTIRDCPNYRISSTGIVKNFKTDNFIKIRIESGYYSVRLYNENGGKRGYIHRIIGECFIPNPDNHPVIDHIDGDRLNNSISNLRWCSYSTNISNFQLNRTNYNKIEQYELSGKLLKVWDSISHATKELGHNRGSLANRCRINGYYKGFVWKYVKSDRVQQIKTKIDMSEYVCIGKIKGGDYSNYYISKCGTKIINNRRQKQISYSNSCGGYKRVHLFDENRAKRVFYVHKIINKVLKNGNYEDIIDHVDENRQNNSLENLEAVTQKENTIRAIGRSVKQIQPETGEVIKIFRTVTEAFKSLDKTCGGCITRVCNGKRKIACGYKWEWCE